MSVSRLIAAFADQSRSIHADRQDVDLGGLVTFAQGCVDGLADRVDAW